MAFCAGLGRRTASSGCSNRAASVLAKVVSPAPRSLLVASLARPTFLHDRHVPAAQPMVVLVVGRPSLVSLRALRLRNRAYAHGTPGSVRVQTT